MPARQTLGAVFIASVALWAQPAKAETWCIRDAGSPPPGACVFPSAHDCGNAARLNPFGGICERQPLGLNDRAEDKRTAGRRSTRRKSTSQQ
jgi:hypothetical protein